MAWKMMRALAMGAALAVCGAAQAQTQGSPALAPPADEELIRLLGTGPA